MSLEVVKLQTDKFHEDTEVDRFTIAAGAVVPIPTAPEPKFRRRYDRIVAIALNDEAGGMVYRAHSAKLSKALGMISAEEVMQKGHLVDHVVAGEPVGASDHIYSDDGRILYTLLFSAPRLGGSG
ncbi:MAG TPA: hypothetical protein VFK11_01545 [Candidatus Saccharimonadales bacterium]|nr:hypothetical protein [Candidatus Saccharimonadales bacterium]